MANQPNSQPWGELVWLLILWLVAACSLLFGCCFLWLVAACCLVAASVVGCSLLFGCTFCGWLQLVWLLLSLVAAFFGWLQLVVWLLLSLVGCSLLFGCSLSRQHAKCI